MTQQLKRRGKGTQKRESKKGTGHVVFIFPFYQGWQVYVEGWVAKSVARQLATAALWVRIQTSLKNHKWAT